jgi:hypothetical protein
VTAPAAARAPRGAYEGAGRQAAVALRGYSSVIITSDDIDAAAHVAIGIGLAESAHRLVMIGDLAGDTGPLKALVAEEDQHGIYDSFEFGTSFGRIAREVKGVNNLFIMPSGTESPGTEEILSSVRWQQFASEFANADELLLLVVGADARGLDKLASQVDGVVLVGMPRLDAAPTANILAKVPHPTIIPPPKIDFTPEPEPWTPFKIGLAAAALLAVGILAGSLIGPRFTTAKTASLPTRVAAVPIDSARRDSVVVGKSNAIAPSNPLDSAVATAFSVEVLASNTSEGANFELKRHGSAMPSATIALVPIGDTEATWYKVYAGAYPDAMGADQLLGLLRRRHILADSAGSVVRVPLAFLVDSVPSQGGVSAVVRDKIAALASRGVTAYALLQRDGGARLYTGAFERPDQSSLAASALRVAGLTPVLAYRTGRIP